MASVRFAAEIAEDLLFGFADKPVRILSAHLDPLLRELVLEVEGEGVPSVPEVRAFCFDLANRAGQRLTTMTFEEVQRP